MNIVHVVPSFPYANNWGYQENILPKYHKKLGNNVTVITSNKLMDTDGKITVIPCEDYFLKDGVRVIRLEYKQYCNHYLTSINSKLNIYNLLKDLKPDLVFYHSLVSTSIFDVIKYKKKNNPNCIIVRDSHQDYYNFRRKGSLIKWLLIRQWNRIVNKLSIKYVDKVYGVTPWRKTFAEDYYHIPSSKTDVLIMGADDDKIDFKHRNQIREQIRKKNSISDSDFLIVTGGRIDKTKNIHLLMKACSAINGIKLLVFGNVTSDFQAEFDNVLNNCSNCIHIGWINSDKVYDYFLSSDLAVFPGTHSVLWEQACACKVPCVFKAWTEMRHVNNGGNADFIDNVTEVSIKDKILSLYNTEKYETMKKVALSEATDVYLCSNIALKSLSGLLANGK